MPELPEVETVCRGLAKVIKGAVLRHVEVNRPDLRLPIPENMSQHLKGVRVVSLARRAKYILIKMDNDETLLLHLGMSGRMIIQRGRERTHHHDRHDHIVFHFDPDIDVRFNDPRRFGVCLLVRTSELVHHRLLRQLGVEPLEKGFTAAVLAEKLKNRKTSIKSALLDQRLVVGIGNIYASEALYRAGISPKRSAGDCRPADIERLVPAIREVLRAAIRAGGSSLRDYVQTDGELGYFQHQFAVYDREGMPCPDCDCLLDKTGGIQRLAQGGRSSFYCRTRQR